MKDMAAMNSSPMAKLNEKCPIKTNRDADPSITAKNEKGETVAFCCNGCKNKFMAALPAPNSKDKMMMVKMENKMMGQMSDMGSNNKMSSESNQPNSTPTRDAKSLRASEVGHPAPRGHLILQFGGSPRDQIQVSHKEAAVNQVLAMLNGYVEKNLVNNKKSDALLKIEKGNSMEERVNLSFLTLLQRKPNTKEMSDFKEMIKKLDVEDYHKDIVWTLLNSHEFLFVQ
jgi:hypothetical protein